MEIKYEFTGTVWQYAAPNGWYFVSMPEKLSNEIRDAFQSDEEGWGRLKAKAKIGSSEWNTSVWFDSKLKTYILPLKAEIRSKEKLTTGKNVKVIVMI